MPDGNQHIFQFPVRLPQVPEQIAHQQHHSQSYPESHQPKVGLRNDVHHRKPQGQDQQYPQEDIDFKTMPKHPPEDRRIENLLQEKPVFDDFMNL
jgi:hypothetical protein